MLGYNLPKKLLSKISMTNLRIYASAENLFTVTQYPGWILKRRIVLVTCIRSIGLSQSVLMLVFKQEWYEKK